MEQRVAADQGNVASAGTMDVAGLAGGNKRPWLDHVRRLAGATELRGGQLAQVVACRLQCKLAFDGSDIGAEMDPDGAALGNRALSARAAGHKVVETEMPELMTAVGGEDHVADGRGSDERAQGFEPAYEAAAALGGRLPPRAARGHHHHRGK